MPLPLAAADAASRRYAAPCLRSERGLFMMRAAATHEVFYMRASAFAYMPFMPLR